MDSARFRRCYVRTLVIATVIIVGYLVAIVVSAGLRRAAIHALWNYNVIYARDGLSVSFENIDGSAPFAEIVEKVNRLGGAPSLFIVKCNLAEHDAKILASITNVRTIYITASSISKGGIAAFHDTKTLRILSIGVCGLSDDAVLAVADIRQLRRLELWEDGVSNSAIAKLKERRPDLEVEVRRSPDFWNQSKGARNL